MSLTPFTMSIVVSIDDADLATGTDVTQFQNAFTQDLVGQRTIQTVGDFSVPFSFDFVRSTGLISGGLFPTRHTRC